MPCSFRLVVINVPHRAPSESEGDTENFLYCVQCTVYPQRGAQVAKTLRFFRKTTSDPNRLWENSLRSSMKRDVQSSAAHLYLSAAQAVGTRDEPPTRTSPHRSSPHCRFVGLCNTSKSPLMNASYFLLYHPRNRYRGYHGVRDWEREGLFRTLPPISPALSSHRADVRTAAVGIIRTSEVVDGCTADGQRHWTPYRTQPYNGSQLIMWPISVRPEAIMVSGQSPTQDLFISFVRGEIRRLAALGPSIRDRGLGFPA
ncbi:hypothetical protein QBC38DRAFT_109572 [Podospora fimiseda]|uniref:Uncharacterized protein n=1 Tax=Podospora fimiseda TaxID=252190 RepID=A0AAN7H536_9PEZI|nr:hypothetical protein QBC38DRAFT_109572 [Podospora fimiseda]